MTLMAVYAHTLSPLPTKAQTREPRRIEEAPVVVYGSIRRNDSFRVTSNRRKLLYVAVPVIR